jgi:hypothetical protein
MPDMRVVEDESLDMRSKILNSLKKELKASISGLSIVLSVRLHLFKNLTSRYVMSRHASSKGLRRQLPLRCRVSYCFWSEKCRFSDMEGRCISALLLITFFPFLTRQSLRYMKAG